MPFSHAARHFSFQETDIDAIDLPRLRLVSQGIANSSWNTPSAAVAHLGALQGQDLTQALWAVGLRVPGSTVKQVRAALSGKEIVRTWLLRGTLHLAAAGDLRWMLALLGPRNIAGAAGRHRQLELDDKVIAASRKLIVKALRDGATVSRPDLFELLDSKGIATAGQRGIHILWQLSQEGVLCYADHIGKQPAFALLDDWLPASGPAYTRDEALAQLAARYFRSHGPATVADFACWSGLTLGDARRGLQGAQGGSPALQSVAFDGADYWMEEGALDAGADAGGVHLLAGFDEYLLGYKDRSAVLAAEHAQQVSPGGNGVFKPMLVVDGHIAGTWQAREGEVAVDPFLPLKRARSKELAAATARYRAFWAEAA